MHEERPRPVGLGGMRLPMEADPDAPDHPGLAVLLAAIDAGVDLVDVADVYGRDHEDLGHAERLAARARAARPGRLTVVTKGGLVRHPGHYHPDGRARHLAAAAAASRARLGGAPLDLYLLHAVDPKVPLATSVRALARLVEDGVAARIGLANVGRAQLDAALALAPVAAIEVELSPWKLDALRGGLVERCVERGILVLAHRPFGGPGGARRVANDPTLAEVAARLGATPHEVALAWLRALAPVIVPIPGASRVETAVSAARAARLVLDDDARRILDARFLGGLADRVGPGAPPPRRAGDVVVVMGMPGAGKTTAVAPLCEQGYLRLNRDERGGTLDGLARRLDDALAAGETRVVLDNTYPTRSSRAPVIAAARRHGLPVRCVWLDTPIEEAQVNAVLRLLDRHGRLLEPDELARAGRRDPSTFPPGVQFRWRRELEPPSTDEGFAAVDVHPFVRRPSPSGRPALIVDLDDVVRVGRPTRPDDVALVPGAAEALARWRAAGWAVVATSWAPAVGEGSASRADVEAAFARTAELTGAPLPVAWCGHPAGPPRCWCRKPLPGLGLVLARDHGLDLARSVHVGRGAADRGFAARLGAAFRDADAWLAGAPPPA